MTRWKGFAAGVIGGVAGLVAMDLARRLTAPLVSGDEGIDEIATDALGRIAYETALHRAPSRAVQRRLSLAVHIGYGLTSAGAFGALTGAPRAALRAGALFGAALWLVGDELAAPLLGLTARRTMYTASQHAQALIAHVAYGVATATTARALVG